MNIDWSKAPEATHFDPVDQNFLREIGSALLLFNCHKGWTVPIHTAYGVTIEDCNRPLIQRPPWNGEGLPPVGTVCEYRADGWPRDQWEIRKVMYVSDYHVITKEADGIERRVDGGKAAFRPIRTAEQIAAEEREKAIDEMAGWAGVTGLDLDRERRILGRLYDGGYRKQVQP